VTRFKRGEAWLPRHSVLTRTAGGTSFEPGIQGCKHKRKNMIGLRCAIVRDNCLSALSPHRNSPRGCAETSTTGRRCASNSSTPRAPRQQRAQLTKRASSAETLRHADRKCPKRFAGALAQACEVVGVDDGQGRYSCPVRRETSITRVSRDDIVRAKARVESDNHLFL
jgi:hypothetical protein